MGNSTTAMPEGSSQQIVRELFFEQDVEVLATSYKHGLLRSLAVLGRTLLFSRGESGLDAPLVPGSTIAVVFFPNELEAIRRAPPARLEVDRILAFDVHRLSTVRRTLGLGGLARECVAFARLAMREKGLRYLGRLTYPLLGWLMYRSLCVRLEGVRGLRVVTTNLQHPLSIGVAWAARQAGRDSVFYEHATTPRLVFRDRGYRDCFVQFEHTGRMLVEHGVAPDRVHVLQPPFAAGALQPTGPIRRVGVCVNVLDTIEAIEDITAVLRDRGLALTYRIHDADPRVTELRRIADREGVELSNARDSRIETFLAAVDLVVVGNSNVIADALIAGRRVVYYWSGTPDMYDYYGLVSHYRIAAAHDAGTLRGVMASLCDPA